MWEGSNGRFASSSCFSVALRTKPRHDFPVVGPSIQDLRIRQQRGTQEQELLKSRRARIGEP